VWTPMLGDGRSAMGSSLRRSRCSAGEGFTYRIGRTALNATAMRGLFAKLGFEELPVRDAVFPERTYWLLRL